MTPRASDWRIFRGERTPHERIDQLPGAPPWRSYGAADIVHDDPVPLEPDPKHDARAGESACVSPENFDAEIGRKVAGEHAVNKIWPLMGYELRTKLAGL